MTGRGVALALLSVALSTWTHGAAGCLPDKACEGGLTVTYGSLELECDQDVAKGTVTNAPSLRIVGNSQTQVRGRFSSSWILHHGHDPNTRKNAVYY